MKKLILAGALALAATGAQAQYYGTGSNPSHHSTSGYTRSNGTYVEPYVATNPNSTQRDNYSATGNVTSRCGSLPGQRHCMAGWRWLFVLDVRQNSPDVGCFLFGHAAVLVEIERLVTREARSRQFAGHRIDRSD